MAAYRSELEGIFKQLLEGADESERSQLSAVLEGRDDIILPSYVLDEEFAPGDDETTKSMHKLIAALSLPQKIKLALRGNKAARSILLRDSNRQVPPLVLENPQITEDEIAELAQNTNTDEELLRLIANNGRWMRSYVLKLAIVANPKVPLDLSIKWVKHLRDADLRRLSRSRNIPQVLATLCMRTLAMRDK